MKKGARLDRKPKGKAQNLSGEPAVETLLDPFPVRLHRSDEDLVRDMRLKGPAERSLSKADVIRLAVRFALPRFISGEANPFDFYKPDARCTE